MRSQALNALVGILTLAVMVASAPALSYGLPDVCDSTTVFVTISSLSTVTSYQDPAQTVYVTLPCSSDIQSSTPTTTLTRVNTLASTTYLQVDTVYFTAPGATSTVLAEVAATAKAPHQVIITETTVLVVTDVQLTPLHSGGSLTYSETAAPNGLLTFVVENGTTYWLNGQTPAPSESYVVETSVVTVVPIASAASSSDTSTVTLHTTLYSTQEFTITETLSTPSPTNSASVYAETGSSFTGIAAGGWNATSTTRSALQTGAAAYPTTRSLLLLMTQDPSFNLATMYSIVSSTSLAAQTGFNAVTTSSAAGSTSSVAGAFTSPVPPYANTTLAQSSPASIGLAPVTSSASGTAVSAASGSFPTGYSSTPSQLASSTAIASSYATGVPMSSTQSMTNATQSSTFAASTVSATPSTYGEVGDFTLNFDDIPPLSVSNKDPNNVQPEPVFNPYHQFDFSDGFVVVLPPNSPYQPSSKPLFTEFIPNFNANGTNSMAGPNTLEYGYSGDIGNGDHGLTGCFGFNVYGASLGCDSQGPACNFHFTGFRLDRTTGNTTAVTSQGIAVPACPALNNCALTRVNLDRSFRDLDSIRINVTVASASKIWWMDDLRLGWYNNSCATGLCRQTAHIH